MRKLHLIKSSCGTPVIQQWDETDEQALSESIAIKNSLGYTSKPFYKTYHKHAPKGRNGKLAILDKKRIVKVGMVKFIVPAYNKLRK
jgi:hypothetical protein